MQLPNFLLVGAAKAGTTALYRYLSQHPDIFMPRELKESFFLCDLQKNSFRGPGHHFVDRAITDLDSYKDLFAGTRNSLAVGEACVAYLYYHKATIPNIRKFLPDNVSILISLRDPVDRAYSNYMHHVREGLESRSFMDAISREHERRERGWWWGFRYVDLGMYHEQVKAYIDEFGRRRVKIILFDDFVQDATRVMRELFRFLSIDPAFAVDTSTKYNVSGIWRPWLSPIMNPRSMTRRTLRAVLPRNLRQSLQRTRAVAQLRNRALTRSRLNPGDREALLRLFEPDITKLADLIGRDLNAWLE